MCRWNFLGLMQHPKIRKLDYYCRMDTDSRIKSKARLTPAVLCCSPCCHPALQDGHTQVNTQYRSWPTTQTRRSPQPSPPVFLTRPHRSGLTSSLNFAKINYDFFETMKEKGAHYGYYMMSTEMPIATKGLWNFVEDYVNTHLRRETARSDASYDVGAQLSGFKVRALNTTGRLDGTVKFYQGLCRHAPFSREMARGLQAVSRSGLSARVHEQVSGTDGPSGLALLRWNQA